GRYGQSVPNVAVLWSHPRENCAERSSLPVPRGRGGAGVPSLTRASLLHRLLLDLCTETHGQTCCYQTSTSTLLGIVPRARSIEAAHRVVHGTASGLHSRLLGWAAEKGCTPARSSHPCVCPPPPFPHTGAVNRGHDTVESKRRA